MDFIEPEPARLHDRRQKQVLTHIEAREDAALLRHVGNSQPRNAFGRPVDGFLAVVHDRSRARAHDAHDRPHSRRLADAIAAEQSHDLALAHLEGDVADGGHASGLLEELGPGEVRVGRADDLLRLGTVDLPHAPARQHRLGRGIGPFVPVGHPGRRYWEHLLVRARQGLRSSQRARDRQRAARCR